MSGLLWFGLVCLLGCLVEWLTRRFSPYVVGEAVVINAEDDERG